ncbi:MAG: CPBP family intramembrane metalloprotease [Candidatus Nealsonbacteria bacterium]|nr:CPBP family intramembrane metalloprotease [Candidatus Nealsonbacteria bacterium]
MSIDQPYRSPAEPPQDVPAVAAPSRKAFPGIWGAIALCLLFLAMQVGVGIVYAIVMIVIGGQQAADESMVLAMGPINIVAFAVTMLVGLVFGGLRWSEVVRLTPFRGALLAPIAVAVVGIGILASELDNVSRFILPMPDFIAKLAEDMMSGGLAMAIVLVVVAPLTEELLFRGLILRGFLKRYGTVPAVLLSTLLFALVHLNPYQFASAITMGIFLAWLFVRTRSLWPCIIAHALFNCHVIVLPILHDTFGLEIRGYTGMPGDGAAVFQPLWFDALGLVLVGLGVWIAALLAGPVPPAARDAVPVDSSSGSQRRRKLRVLFLCTGNSCRSQMAEGWARALKADAIEAYSAGIETHGLNPHAVAVMKEAGVDISGHQSKHVDQLAEVDFDVVVTVCGNAHETCPVFPGAPRVFHAGFDDPPRLAATAATEEEALNHYRRVRDDIRAMVERLPEALDLTG